MTEEVKTEENLAVVENTTAEPEVVAEEKVEAPAVEAAE